MSLRTAPEAALKAVRMVRTAWFDEMLEAEARGDAEAAARANVQLTVCDQTLRSLLDRRHTTSGNFLLDLVRRR